MTYPMPPELLEQLGLEPCAGTDPPWPEDHDALGWGRRAVIDREVELPERREQPIGIGRLIRPADVALTLRRLDRPRDERDDIRDLLAAEGQHVERER